MLRKVHLHTEDDTTFEFSGYSLPSFLLFIFSGCFLALSTWLLFFKFGYMFSILFKEMSAAIVISWVFVIAMLIAFLGAIVSFYYSVTLLFVQFHLDLSESRTISYRYFKMFGMERFDGNLSEDFILSYASSDSGDGVSVFISDPNSFVEYIYLKEFETADEANEYIFRLLEKSVGRENSDQVGQVP